jgi:hypothetical protein
MSNQLIYILNTNSGIRHEQVLITQEKVIPAIHEKKYLLERGKDLYASSGAKYIISHGNFVFSGLICNELLNIDYRRSLRGQIDALIVVEWNKDIETYDPLVSATSNDLHCFVIQVNNRLYGDTRIRAPYKQSYERDQVRVRGGVDDYFVLAELDIKSLRAFQLGEGTDQFKPVPTGFEMSERRKKKGLIIKIHGKG